MAIARYGRQTTGLEHRPSTQPLLDRSGRFAHYYGSEGPGRADLDTWIRGGLHLAREYQPSTGSVKGSKILWPTRPTA
jgi:hypothetical protein